MSSFGNRQRDELLAGRYRLGKRLVKDEGTGAYYEALDERLGRRVTIKCLVTSESPRTLRRYEREARILGALQHPALLQVFDAALDREPFLVMEPVQGTPLLGWAQLPLPIPDAIRIAEQLAEAVCRAHARGFLHRRIVPEHIFISDQGAPKLLGFGRASFGGGHGSSTSDIQLGPSGFLNPELFLSEEKDPRNDIYGLGAVLYYLLTGRAPLPIEETKNTAEAIFMLIKQERTPLRVHRPDAPVSLEALLSRTLSVEIDQRPQSAMEWLGSLRRLRDHKRVSGITERFPQLGDRIGDRYEVEATIGRGSHGTVVLASDEELQRRVAIKFIDGDANELLLEARAMAQVTHPNVVQVYDVGTREGRGYLVMENVPGRSVEALLEERKPTRDEAVAILDQTARGLSAIHQAGLVHGDVKPSNVLIGPAFRVCVADFGLVRKASTWADPKAQLGGTPAYFAPERVERKIQAALAFSIDLYALGVVAFELLTHSLPFNGRTPLELLERHRTQPAPSVTERDPSLAAYAPVVMRAMSKDPATRFASVEEFRSALVAAHENASRVEGNARVMVVDSDRTAGNEVATRLRDELRSQVDVANSGAGALALASAERPDLILLDMQLEDMNGIELAGALRADLDNPPPLVVLTAQGSADDWQVLSALGVDAFLFKPADAELLALTVRRILSRQLQSR